MAWERDGPLGPREQSLHEWYWESCFFLYISASQSLPWGWWCLTHWVPEQLNTLVELKKHQGGERMWGLSSGAVPRSWDPPTLLRRVALCPDAPAAGTCFFSTPSCWCLQGLAADLLEGGPHTMNGSSKSLSPLLTSERAALSFTLRMWKPETTHLWTCSQGHNSYWTGLGYLFDNHFKNIFFIKHPKNKAKQNKTPRTLGSEGMWFFPINIQWGILIHEHNYRDYLDLWSQSILLLFCGTGFPYLGRRVNDIRNLCSYIKFFPNYVILS